MCTQETSEIQLKQRKGLIGQGSLLGDTKCDKMPDKTPGVSSRLSQRERSGRKKSCCRGTPQKAELQLPAPSSTRLGLTAPEKRRRQ